ncbi:MAG: hypothetical protein K6C97_11810 [Treponema sp.]|nr:hypothetical protein [Treponema sp.]
MNRKTLTDKLLDRWYIKVICLIVAIFLYIFHQASLVEKKTFTVPLHIIENGIVQHVGNIQNSVVLVVRTNPENIKSIGNSDIKATINLNTITEKGNFSIPVFIEISDKLKQMDPFELKLKDQNVDVQVDLKASKYVTLSPSVIGQVAHGYTIAEIQMNPSAVLITGPKSILDATEEVPTTKINVSNAEKNFTTEAFYLENTSLYTIDNSGPYKATVIVEALPYEQEFNQIVIEVLNLPENLEILNELPFVKVKLAGSMPILEAYTVSKHFVQLDCSSITEPGEYELNLKYNVSKNFELIEAPYKSVSISVKEKLIEAEEEGDKELPAGEEASLQGI